MDFLREYRKLCCPECGCFMPPGSNPLMYPHMPTCSRRPDIKAPLIPVPELDKWARERMPGGER